MGSRWRRGHRTQCAGENDLSGPQRLPVLFGGSGQPGQGVERVAEAGAAGALGNQVIVGVHLHGDLPRFEVGQSDPFVAEHEQSTGSVVGHCVGNRQVPVRDATVDDLERGHGVVDRTADTGRGEVAADEVVAEDEGDLCLDLGL